MDDYQQFEHHNDSHPSETSSSSSSRKDVSASLFAQQVRQNGASYSLFQPTTISVSANSTDKSTMLLGEFRDVSRVGKKEASTTSDQTSLVVPRTNTRDGAESIPSISECILFWYHI